MIVGTTNINTHEALKHLKTHEEFNKYAKSIIPKFFGVVPEIVDNQKYLILLSIRKDNTIPWDVKKPILKEFMQGIKIIGYTDTLIDYDTVMSMCDIDVLKAYGRKKDVYNT